MDLSGICCGSKKTSLRVIDLKRSNKNGECLQWTDKTLEFPEDVRKLLQQSSVDVLPRIRILSLHSNRSLAPLNISRELMHDILERYDVDESFLSTLQSFGQAPHVIEAGVTNCSRLSGFNGAQGITYQFRYPELNRRSSDRPWSIRQTGVYHYSSPDGPFDFFIILSPIRNSAFEDQGLTRLLTSSQSSMNSYMANPSQIHSLLIRTYEPNWRACLKHCGERFEDLSDDTMTLDLETVVELDLGFDRVQELRDMLDITIAYSAYCRASSRLIATLQTQAADDHRLDQAHERFLDHHETIQVLGERIRSLIDLLAYALNSKNQQMTTSLMQKGSCDSVALKWITVISLIYLPASFIATLYGMNLFVFDQETRRLVIAGNFWVYIATWLPLTALTLCGYAFFKPRSTHLPGIQKADSGAKRVMSWHSDSTLCESTAWKLGPFKRLGSKSPV